MIQTVRPGPGLLMQPPFRLSVGVILKAQTQDFSVGSQKHLMANFCELSIVQASKPDTLAMVILLCWAPRGRWVKNAKGMAVQMGRQEQLG